MFKNSLPDRCTIQTYSEGSVNGYGHPAKTWANTYTSVPCRLCVSGGKEIQKEKNVVIANHKLYLQGSQTVTEQDRVVLNSKTYNILLVENPSNKSREKILYLEVVK